MSKTKRKAVRDSEANWQLDGESMLNAVVIPDPPKANAPATVRLTHSNVYVPFDDADFYVRVGDPANPTEQNDLNSKRDWVKASLVEELVVVGDEEMLRSEAEEPFEDETPWDGTYEAQLSFPTGRRYIEIKVVSRQPKLLRSLVLYGWEISVR